MSAGLPIAAYNRARKMAPIGEVLDTLSSSRVSSIARGKSPRRATMSHSAWRKSGLLGNRPR